MWNTYVRIYKCPKVPFRMTPIKYWIVSFISVFCGFCSKTTGRANAPNTVHMCTDRIVKGFLLFVEVDINGSIITECTCTILGINKYAISIDTYIDIVGDNSDLEFRLNNSTITYGRYNLSYNETTLLMIRRTNLPTSTCLVIDGYSTAKDEDSGNRISTTRSTNTVDNGNRSTVTRTRDTEDSRNLTAVTRKSTNTTDCSQKGTCATPTCLIIGGVSTFIILTLVAVIVILVKQKSYLGEKHDCPDDDEGFYDVYEGSILICYKCEEDLAVATKPMEINDGNAAQSTSNPEHVYYNNPPQNSIRLKDTATEELVMSRKSVQMGNENDQYEIPTTNQQPSEAINASAYYNESDDVSNPISDYTSLDQSCLSEHVYNTVG